MNFLKNRFVIGAVSGTIVVAFTLLSRLLVDDFREGWTIASVIGSGLIILVLVTLQGTVLVKVLKWLENTKFLKE